jgi:hypothetical protein
MATQHEDSPPETTAAGTEVVHCPFVERWEGLERSNFLINYKTVLAINRYCFSY